MTWAKVLKFGGELRVWREVYCSQKMGCVGEVAGNVAC